MPNYATEFLHKYLRYYKENALDLRWKGDTGVVDTVDRDVFLARTHPRNKTFNMLLHPSTLQLSHL